MNIYEMTPQMRYQTTHTRQIGFKLNLKYDKDILDKLDAVENKQGYIKDLIRKDIKRGG